ncbi:conserved membrane hypothetical protein [Desulfamplus magnetovallimortis]|uniref:Uncharacterized protein n=1 Tax=Desulfamplus magnetovallimortis TaxID=1246637 RepID=A0A1W1H636_9BACT|nr:ABC transporter permease [Desulfamplus magnetovallimortis]SLM27933.1 conserved membrane hypothetical protein [Desulfamplus magnetovallimortis]
MGTISCDLHKNELNQSGLLVVMAGDFIMDSPPASSIDLVEKIHSIKDLKYIIFKTDGLQRWDSTFLALINDIHSYCSKKSIEWIDDSLPGGVRRLLALAHAVPERRGSIEAARKPSFITVFGGKVIDFANASSDIIAFTGDAFWAFLRLISGRYKIRGSVIFPVIKECSADALPIVSLISALVGLILAFVGAVQLVMFGAQIYVASLVGIAMIRVMGAVMAGVIMAGRTGAAFAAQLGTMEVNEEIDALKTLGISPMEFLVMPRILALSLLMPLLCLYADLMGIMGGMAVGIFMLDLNVMEYYNMTKASVSLNSFWIGLFQSFVFGILVAIAGCMRGMQCKRSASAVGEAATSAVVTGIVAIVVATATITLLCNVLGI